MTGAQVLTNAKPPLKRIALKHWQLVELVDLIRAHINVDNGRTVFADGWSVGLIIAAATAKGIPCNERHVENICRDVLKAPLAIEHDTVSSTMKRVRDLETRLDRATTDLNHVMNFLTRQHGPGWK